MLIQKKRILWELELDFTLWRDGEFGFTWSKEESRKNAFNESTDEVYNCYMDDIKEGEYTLEEYTELVNEALDKVYGK